METKLKAFMISDKNLEVGSTFIWAESSGKAKAKALYSDTFSWDDIKFTDLSAKRVKDFDKYADSKRIPIQELLNWGWWFCCCDCGKEDLDQDKIDAGEAFIFDTEYLYGDFVKGCLICADCLKKRQGGANAI
jgi:hypothetical protein